MHSDQKVQGGKSAPPLAYGVGGLPYNITVPAAIDAGQLGLKPSELFHGVELQPSEMCPKNFIIFDQTDNKSRIMFHPALANKFGYTRFDIHETLTKENTGSKHTTKDSSSYKEDTKDIDALLSLEDEEDEEEEVSTGRTMGNCGRSYPDCNSTDDSKLQKTSSASFQRSFSYSRNSSSSSSERKRHRMDRMLKALRGIVPGSDRMDTASFIDEAVRHLKHLKKEVKKLGMGNFRS